MFKKGIRLFENTKNGFHLFGPDIMVTEDFQIKILEINVFPGFGLLNRSNTFFDKILTQMIDDNVLNPLLSSNEKAKKEKAEKDEKTINKKHINNNIPLFSASVL